MIFDDITLMDKKEFFLLCHKFAEKAIEAVAKFRLPERGIVNESWVAQMRVLLPITAKKARQ
jgi:hypothetical protein